MPASIVTAIETFLLDYCAFPDPAIATVLALWAIGTWTFRAFDAFPYLVITSATKRSGKTRLSELLGFVSHNAKNFSAMTPAVLFRTLGDAGEKGATILFDEAETLSSEAAGVMRSVLNVGYRRGQTIPRLVNSHIEEFPAYCPKVFVLIGDVYDTLRDRSIVITLERREPRKHFTYAAVRDRATDIVAHLPKSIPFLPLDAATLGSIVTGICLTGREAEIWFPIFALAQTLCPERLPALTRVAVDLAAEKTDERRRRYTSLADAEATAQDDTYARRAVADLLAIVNAVAAGATYEGPRAAIYTEEAIARLHAIDVAPWRKYRGDGLTAQTLGRLVSRFKLKARSLKGRDGTVRRGYRFADVRAVAARLNGGGQ